MIYSNIYIYICLYVSGMNDSNIRREESEELGLFCYKVFALPTHGTI